MCGFISLKHLNILSTVKYIDDESLENILKMKFGNILDMQVFFFLISDSHRKHMLIYLQFSFLVKIYRISY